MVKEGHTVVGTLKIAKIYNEHFKVDKKRTECKKKRIKRSIWWS